VTGPLLRLRSDEQLVRLFRAGNEEAFRVIHDRYRARLLAYARQMLGGSRPDAEDALQDVFVRVYGALRASERDVSLRAWLYRIAHNRCIDELRRPAPPTPETLELLRPPANDPVSATEQRESLRRLVADVGRLPEQQRSALLMREISGMSYEGLAEALDVTVPAIKSLLVRARIGLAQAAEARDTACAEVRESLADSHERGVRSSGLARRHLQDCDGCRAYRGELRASSERLAALVPAVGPIALIAQLLGVGGGAAGGAGAATGGAAAAGVGAAGVASGITTTHVVAVVAAAVVGAGGAVEVQRTLQTHHRHAAQPAAQVAAPPSYVPAVTAHLPAARGRKAVDPAVATPLPVPAVEDVNGGAGLPAELTEPAPTDTTPPDAATPVDDTEVPPAPADPDVPAPDEPQSPPASGASSDPAPASGASASGTAPVTSPGGASAPSS
jgi:RNA polymerase sigma factor (sigma-70 family)